MMNSPKIYKIATGEVSFEKIDLVIFKPFRKRKIESSDLIELQDLRLSQYGNKPFYMVYDLSGGTAKVSAEAKAWAVVNRKASQRLMDVFIVKNELTKLAITFFKKLYRSDVPTICVRTKEQAFERISKDKRFRFSRGEIQLATR